MFITIISFLIVISVLVFFHELGHFAVAKFFGVYVKEFSIGMGPTLLKVKGKETKYSIKALPIGGAVQMLGEEGVERNEDDDIYVDENYYVEYEKKVSDDLRSFIVKPAWQRLLIIFAGPFMNFVLAILLFIIVFFNIGSMTTTIDSVIEGSVAEQVGILSGDIIEKIDDTPIKDWLQIQEIIAKKQEKSLIITVNRADQRINVELTPKYDNKEKRFLIGISPRVEHSVTHATKKALIVTGKTSKAIVEFIPKLITGRISSNNLSGPIGIAKISGEYARQGVISFISFMAFVSINLGIMNLLPIPALDGGRILLIVLEIIFRGKINPKIEEKIHYVGFVLLMALMVYVVYNDIAKLF